MHIDFHTPSENQPPRGNQHLWYLVILHNTWSLCYSSTSGLQVHAQLLKTSPPISRCCHVQVCDLVTGWHTSRVHVQLTAGQDTLCSCARWSTTSAGSRKNRQCGISIWKRLRFYEAISHWKKNIYLPSNSVCRLEHNYKSQKMLSFEPPLFCLLLKTWSLRGYHSIATVSFCRLLSAWLSHN